MTEFIPNSFQTPNAYVDRFMALLTPEEFKVLVYAVRRIFGFQKRQDHISLSQFTGGLSNREGDPLDFGTGLSLAATKKALAFLIKYGIIIKLAENDPTNNYGTLYALQLDSNLVREDLLRQRQEKKIERNANRTEKARKARMSDIPPHVPHTPDSPTYVGGGMSDNRGGGMSDRNTKSREIQGNPEEESASAPANLDNWLETIKDAKNKAAALDHMIRTLYPRLVEYPNHSYIGKIARQLGAGRLATILWECVTRNPSGDILAYVQTYAKGKKTEEPRQYREVY